MIFYDFLIQGRTEIYKTVNLSVKKKIIKL